MNIKLKRVLELLVLLVITGIITISSPLNPFVNGAFTQIQNDIFDTAQSIRNGFLAYTELDGNYGPAIYEFWGLGFLPTSTHVVHFVEECIIILAGTAFLYKTAKLYTSEVFAMISAAVLTIFGWGAWTHAGAEELIFVVLALTAYHVNRQLQSGYLAHHTYLLAIDMGLIFFMQPGYVFIWIVLIVFFAIKFKVDGIDSKSYRGFYASIIEGILTVGVPMALYLWYFKNAKDFWTNVVVYNIGNMGSFADGLSIVCGTPWIILLIVLVLVIVVKAIQKEDISSLCCWLGISLVIIIVIALQGDSLASYRQLSKVVYIVPLAAVGSLLDKPLGLGSK
ncbi:MAG: hypothetical protein K6E79_05790 [Pseudobutyrivibrio sp.]|nr:hypothetical protein [Pseudobutyrivibrio sp.]